MRREAIPLWALESQDPVKDFDMIAFTIGYEMAYSNVLNMLDLAGFPSTLRSVPALKISCLLAACVPLTRNLWRTM